MEPLGITAQTLYCQNLESFRYIVVAHSIAYLHSNFCGRLRKTHVFLNRERNGPSRSSKVVDIGTNRKRVWTSYRLSIVTLVISYPVSEILQVYGEEQPHPYFTRILGVFPLV